MKRLLVVSIFIFSLPFLVSVNNCEPSGFAVLAGRVQGGSNHGEYCDPCTYQGPGVCVPAPTDPICFTVADAVEERATSDLPSDVLFLTLAALMIGRLVLNRAF